MVLLKDKNILIMGLRNKYSISWGIAKAASEQGAKLILTYQNDEEKKHVDKLVVELDNYELFKCDVSYDEDIETLFNSIKEKYGILHGVVHSIAHAKTEDLRNDFVHTSREGFAHALNVSAYSLVAVSRYAKDVMTEGGSIITLSYAGAERVFKGYNVMGVAKAALETSVKYLAEDLGPINIRINAISAGPIRTLSARGVKNFSSILDVVEKVSPLRRNITQEDIGGTAIYLLSNLSSGVTGEILHVDCGHNIMGI